MSFSQARNEFKKLVSECKSDSLTNRTASGIARYRVEKGYGKWWHILFTLVARRQSSDPNNMIEPSFDTINQRVESETQPNEVTNVSSQNGKTNMKKQKEKKLEQDIVNLARSFIENNPTKKLLNFLASENERPRRHEAEIMRMMLQINNPVYLTQIRMLPNLNRQYHNQINQRPVAQGLVNMSMSIIRTQYLLLMTPPGLHTNHLISNYWSEKLSSYFIFVFVT